MNKMKIALLFIFTLISSVHSQTVDEIVAQHITAMGGADKLSSLHTLRMTGNLSTQGMDITVITSKSHLTGIRLDISVMGTENYQIVTPTGGTTFMPLQGMVEPGAMTADQLKVLQTELDIQDPLLNYHDKGTTVELLGSEQVDGEAAYKLKLTFNNGHSNDYYVNAHSGYFVKTSGSMNINGQDEQIETRFSNYKQNSDGYWFAYTITNQLGSTEYRNIETNVTIDPNIFK